MKDQELKGHLDLLLLSVVAEGPSHGYGVIARLRERSNNSFDLPEGTVYPALHRLERAGLLEAEWTTANGRRRKTYRLTTSGGRALEEKRSGWEEFATAVRLVIGGAPWPATN